MKLVDLQRTMAKALMAPFTPRDRVSNQSWREAASLLKPNDQLTARERFDIYHRSYWARLLDSMQEDFPGLLHIIGEASFRRLATAYLRDCPSSSFTLRDLGHGLEAWLRTHPDVAGQQDRLALDMVRLEWAHIVAFDAAAKKPLDTEDLAELGGSLRLALQPYLSLLDLQYPVDQLRVELNSAPDEATPPRTLRKSPAPLYLAVHRQELNVYYRRLDPEEYRLLTALRAGRTVERAIRLAFSASAANASQIPDLIGGYFSAWAQLGWLSKGTS